MTSWRDRLQWTPHGYEQASNEDNPRRRPCSWCGAAPGHDCTRTIRGGRRVPITGYHETRTRPDDQEAPVRPPSSHQEPRT